MTTKEYLSQAFKLDELIKVKESRIQDLQDMQMRTGQLYSGPKVQTSLILDKMGNTMAELVDLISECQQDYLRLLVIWNEIEAVVDSVEYLEHRLILFERYVNMKNWGDIAMDNGYTERHVLRLHREALQKIEGGELLDNK